MIPSRAQFLEIINVVDCLALVIRGHQSIEAALNAAISETLLEPHAIEIEQIGFSVKADLAVALRIIRADSLPLFTILNRTRNRFAHRAAATFQASDATDIRNCLSDWQRHALGEQLGSEAIDVLRQCIAIAFIEAKGALHRLQEQKLANVVLHELVLETLSGSPIGEKSPELMSVEHELRERLESKKLDLGLTPEGYFTEPWPKCDC
jgi:hypothetical protein